MLCQQLERNGFCFIDAAHYLDDENTSSLQDLKMIFDKDLENDGLAFRKRAYMKLIWNRSNDTLALADNQNYFQTAAANTVDGGKIRKFKTMHPDVLQLPILKSLIEKNLDILKENISTPNDNFLQIGLHFIRYQVNQYEASYSSPDWLHKDDEPLVFVHLVNLSKTALGGDNLIANSESKKITHVLRLENEIDTLVVNKDVYHAVTPLGSRAGIAYRDVILFTVEPAYIQ